jgi:hypothetical protein
MADLDPVAKLSQILAADPRSRVFVELARALAARGELQKAIDVCWGGLQHHPDSVQARAILGGALLDQGRPEDALEPLERAAKLAPSDARVRELLEEARREATPGQVAHAAPAPPAPAFPPRAEDPETLARGRQPPRLEREPHAGEPPGPALPPGAPAAGLADIEHFLDQASVRDPERELTGSVPLSEPVPVLGERPMPPTPGPPPAAPSPQGEASLPPPLRPQPPPLRVPPPLAEVSPAPEPSPPTSATPAPGASPSGSKRKRAFRRDKTTSTALRLPDDPAAAARIAAKYEAELRDEMLKREKHEVRRGPAIAAVAAVLLVLASLATYALVRRIRRADEARSAVAARAGLARARRGLSARRPGP